MIRSEPLETLLDKLSSGDPDAAQRVFVAYEPYLRMVVRRRLTPALRVKFDSLDIVQSVWADLLTGFQTGKWQFDDPDQLRSFLIKVTRNRLIDRVRQQQTPLRLEQRLEGNALSEVPHDRPIRPGEHLEAEEMWQALLDLCPARHRPVLEFKRQGLCLPEIAQRSGLHESSVRRILYELASRLANHTSCRLLADSVRNRL
jgi:RNA polymerase sigma-70 factor (ECF subfamily)